MVYHSILVPLDGSPFAEHALPCACEIARRVSATLHLVHIHTLSTTPIYIEGYPVIDENLASLSREHERMYLEQVKARLTEIHSEIEIIVEVLDRSLENIVNESVGAFLAAHLIEQQVDLVVMTTHGHGGLVRFWLGSVADSLVRLTSVPILLVRPTETPPDFAHPPLFQQVLVPLDGSALSEQILEPTLALGALLPTEYMLLRIVEPLYVDYNLITHTDTLDKEAIQAAQSYLDTLAQRLRSKNLAVSTQVMLAQNPAVVILEQAQRRADTLIAMATHGRSGVRRLLIGSIADKVLRGAETAVLVYRPQEEHMQV